jgi:hypothetical protein
MVQPMNAGAHDERAFNWLRQILFALNIGLGAAIVLRAYVARFALGRSTLSDLSTQMIIWFNGIFHYPTKSQALGIELTFLTWIAAAALTVLLVLRFLMPKTAAPRFLRIAGITTALMAVPAAILFAYTVEQAEMVMRAVPLINNNIVSLVLETGVALICLVLCFYRKWPIPYWGTVILLVLHYILWSWMISSLFDPPMWALILSLVPACAGLAWIPYARSLNGDVSGNKVQIDHPHVR